MNLALRSDVLVRDQVFATLDPTARRYRPEMPPELIPMKATKTQNNGGQVLLGDRYRWFYSVGGHTAWSTLSRRP
jgi:hypothetical protein